MSTYNLYAFQDTNANRTHVAVVAEVLRINRLEVCVLVHAAIVVCRIEYGKEKRAAAQNADMPSEDAPSENGTSQDA